MKPTKILCAVLLSAVLAASCGGTPEPETKAAALTSAQIWQSNPEGGPFTTETYSCAGQTWRQRQYIRQYAYSGAYYTGFISATNKPGSIDYTKNEATFQCSTDWMNNNLSTYLESPYHSPSTAPDITCDVYTHFAGSGWNFSVRTKIPWSGSAYQAIASGWPYGAWSVYMKFPAAGSPDWGTGYGTSCFVGTSHQFPID